jgi:hypothetical protein
VGVTWRVGIEEGYGQSVLTGCLFGGGIDMCLGYTGRVFYSWNLYNNITQFYEIYFAESNPSSIFSITYPFPKFYVTNNFRYLYSGLLN